MDENTNEIKITAKINHSTLDLKTRTNSYRDFFARAFIGVTLRMLPSSFFLILPITRSYSQWNLSLAPENTFLQMTKSLRFEQSFLGTQFGGSTLSLS